ncbi:tyrosine phosphatase family protein [Enterovirga rhinocerotis]|uniref:Tyrosine specific protein phosphatases domain-containing protein n=1 Tax=Enterovirga rhinocerotis TaxID=1339210 RepID=A0A4V3DX50_9HYPH|nr:hypothetical protein [Enterovirga rhinocerotis]TDR87309.1 putative protein tyrosine phosphatase [Enterovirga rhinocerotis]
MSVILVCPDAEACAVAAEHAPSHVVSLASPGTPPPIVANLRRLALVFHDIAEPREGLVAPEAASVERLVAFGSAWSGEKPLLVHCRMGISRSTAAAIILAAARRPSRPEVEIAQALRDAAPCATPNPLMIALADRLLGRGGRLIEAVRAIGRGADYRPYRLAALDAD